MKAFKHPQMWKRVTDWEEKKEERKHIWNKQTNKKRIYKLAKIYISMICTVYNLLDVQYVAQCMLYK